MLFYVQFFFLSFFFCFAKVNIYTIVKNGVNGFGFGFKWALLAENKWKHKGMCYI